ncbi:MAG: hypothetical protein Q8N26_12755 [Myxococcales bacterium]|nr:hypothetical protein [Myxococcales bacterium]
MLRAPPTTLVFVALLVSGAANAQASYRDDFEGTLTGFDSPPGVWDFIGLRYPMQSVVTDAAAVRRGTRGLRTIDAHRDAGVDTQVVLGRNLTGMGSQYARAWWRVTASSSVDSRLSFLMVQGSTTIGTLGELKWNPLAEQVRLVCFDRLSTFFLPGTSLPVPLDGGFHLVELAVQNVGSGGATCAWAFDGQERARQAIDLFNVQLVNVLVGPVYGETEWTGVMDYDDFAASSMPMASRLEVTTAAVRAGQCESVFVEGRSSFSTQPALLSSQTRLVVRLDGGTLFADSNCATSLGSGTAYLLPVGSMGRDLRVRAASSTVVVELVSDDLMPSTHLVAVIPDDAGIDGGALDAGSADAGQPDAGGPDAGSADAGQPDAGGPDAGEVDAGGMRADGGAIDGGPGDAGSAFDAGALDAGVADAGTEPLGRGDYLVGCSCSSEGGLLVICALLLVAGARPRRSGRRGTSRWR